MFLFYLQCFANLTQWENLERFSSLNIDDNDPPDLDKIWTNSFYQVSSDAFYSGVLVFLSTNKRALRTWVLGNATTRESKSKHCLWASHTIMRRTFERVTKARLSFSGGPHAPVNMADSMENAGVPKNSKYLQKHGVRNIAQYRAANVLFSAFFSTNIHFFHTIRHVYRTVLGICLFCWNREG